MPLQRHPEAGLLFAWSFYPKSQPDDERESWRRVGRKQQPIYERLSFPVFKHLCPQRRHHQTFSSQLAFSSRYLSFTPNWTVAVFFLGETHSSLCRLSCLICEKDSTYFLESQSLQNIFTLLFVIKTPLSFTSPSVRMKKLRFQQVKQIVQGHLRNK